jgi:hypothetical protein
MRRLKIQTETLPAARAAIQELRGVDERRSKLKNGGR